MIAYRNVSHLNDLKSLHSILDGVPSTTYSTSPMLSRVAVSILCLFVLHRCAAHMMLDNPVPYGKSTLNNSPLEGTGLDFPCKLRRDAYDLTQMNYWTAGEAQTISFLGSAVHGGGSCQFSLTKDPQPTKSSKWKVIHSVIGGCPATVDGNLREDPAGRGSATFNVTIPKSIPDGRYTFAWTWFNRQGDREMYMNCAPLSISGGGNETTLLDTLPDMFIANLPSTACSTVQDFDYAFPDPGDSVETGSQAKIVTTLSGTGCASVTSQGAESRMTRASQHLTHSLPDGSVRTASSSRLAASAISSPLSAARNAGVEVVSRKTTAVEPQTLVVQAISIVADQDAVPAPTPSATLPPSAGACIPCQPDDHILCIDQTHFGLCNLGCAYPQLLASGTLCFNGEILRRGAKFLIA